MKIGHWTYHTIIDYQDYFGFTYKITCSVNNKWYIGSKFFRVKCGQKGKYRKEDWLDYTGSSKTLNADITKYGKDKFWPAPAIEENARQQNEGVFYIDLFRKKMIDKDESR